MIIERLKSGKHRCRVWNNELGRRESVGTFPTRSAAKAAGHRAEIELDERGTLAPRSDMTFGCLCDHYLGTMTNLAASTQAWYGNALKPARAHFGERGSVRRLTRADVQSYAASLTRAKRSPNTVRSYVKAVSILMIYAVELGIRDDNPAERLRNLPKKKRLAGAVRAITQEEHHRLVSAVRTEFGQGRGTKRYRGYQVMISLMPLVGLRKSEMQGLQWSAIDLEARILRVERQMRPDGNLDTDLKTWKSRRVVALPEVAVRVLREWRLECPPTEWDLVFPSARGRGQNQAQFYRIWHEARDTADLAGLDPHDLRHTFATWNLAAGCNPKWVADQMGHEKPSTMLDIYAHLLPSADEDAARRMNAWLQREAC